MTRKLSLRLDSLESAAASIDKAPQVTRETTKRREKAMARLAEIVEEFETGIPPWKKLNHASQVRYWKERVKDAKETLKGGVNGIPPTPGLAPGVDLIMREMALSSAPGQLAEAQEQLAKLTAK